MGYSVDGRIRFPLRTLCLLGAVLLPAELYGQKYTPPTPPIDAPCVPTKKDPCTTPVTPAAQPTAQRYPFPGEDAQDAPAAPSTSTPAAPPQGGRYPFPGETPDPAAAPQDPSSSSPPTSSSSSSSSSTSSSSSQPSASGSPDTSPGGSRAAAGASRPAAGTATDDDNDDDLTAPRATRRRLPKVEDTDAREAKDLEVSAFYLSTGDYLGAYNRGKDAVRLYPKDPEAHFALAQAAARLKKVEEARAEYTLSLQLDLSEDHARVAQRALQQLR